MVKTKKALDWSSAECSHYVLRLAYIGTRYCGVSWQRPDQGNTVENELFIVLVRACLIQNRETCNFSRCGRTDKGVHAFGNYISLTLRVLPGGTKEYIRLLNRLLPKDIRILAATSVPSGYDARFRCTGRLYKYFFHASGYDTDRMRRAAQAFLGEHDFRNFCKADVEQTSTFLRTMHRVEFEVQDQCVAVTIAGNAFLWHQIRCMMSVLFLVGKGLEDESIVAQMLDINTVASKPIYDMASEDGLVLFDATYPDFTLTPDPDALVAFRTAHAEAQRRVAVLDCLAGSAPVLPSGVTKHKSLLARPREPTIDERLKKVKRITTSDSMECVGAANVSADSAVNSTSTVACAEEEREGGGGGEMGGGSAGVSAGDSRIGEESSSRPQEVSC
eukprot:TRINITY_DN67831_c0_g1_i1.p1 TRINITY_DN67831_c0_g1~~TRINITY_DN67831_c0_g1_i1.p1  ORF type:complete len:389 (-),score=51.37 TRINITY_DN67831_c0_g1_i1:77-1243(-)